MSTPASPPFDAIAHLLTRWKLVAIAAVLGAAGAFAYVMVAPPWYAATLTVVPSQRSHESAAMSFASKLPISFDAVPTDVQRIHAVLRSTSVTDEVIDKFNLIARYEAGVREKARTELWSHCATNVDRKSGVVSLSCEDKDPKQAQAMAAYFGEVGNRVFGRVSASSAREERKFLEAQLSKARIDIDTASRKLRAFQEKHKVVDLPEQSKAVISAMAEIKGEMLSKQIELSYLSSFASKTEANVVQLQQQLAVLDRKLQQLEQSVPAPPSAAGSAATGNFFPDAMKVPELRFELEQLMREQKIQETLFLLVTQRYEMARVDEARDTSTFQILDHPTLPSYRVRPRRMRTIAIGMFAGLVLGCVFALAPAYLRRRRLSS